MRLYKQWTYLDRKIERLLLRWSDIEGWLIKEHNWFRLSKAEQAALPEGQPLREADAQLKSLFKERDILLEKLPTSGARTLQTVVARLGVVERLLFKEDHPEAHAMIVGSRRDLTAIMARAS